ncbi:hypothetical protein PGTUg99_011579 [Puccinia graminis f. sp. tritici]|uniref:Uncharacterized protein n=1 Tax=Puccinia graminis f. sp. tritici TaxID=56615 RepID=A0A5B0LSR0_PUCGR|nr:hypothetical protein PGTUg99_011579 [Puccinia graminis f. sp. tritici]
MAETNPVLSEPISNGTHQHTGTQAATDATGHFFVRKLALVALSSSTNRANMGCTCASQDTSHAPRLGDGRAGTGSSRSQACSFRRRLLWNANDLSFRALRGASSFRGIYVQTPSNFKRLFSSTNSSAFLNQSTKPEEPKRFVSYVLWTRSICGVVHPNAYLVVTRDTYAAAKLLIYHTSTHIYFRHIQNSV